MAQVNDLIVNGESRFLNDIKGYIGAGRREGTTIGNYSTAEGYYTGASGNYSHAEGFCTSAVGSYSHSEGRSTSAGSESHAEGYFSCTQGNRGSHAEGAYCLVKGSTMYSGHAEGYYTTVTGDYGCHSEGYYTCTTSNSSHVSGKYNTVVDRALIVGGGTSGTRKNIFSIDWSGVLRAASTVNANTQDYAEYFEWADGNLNNEDRVGYFVTFDEEDNNKIRIANSNDDYILGIISGEPSVLGNSDCFDIWNGAILRDKFNRAIYEDIPMYKLNEETGEEEPVLDEDGNQVYEKQAKINPEYDPNRKYLFRKERPEWDAVGMLGVLRTHDDGTCIPGKFCTINNEGIATKIDNYNRLTNCYKVIKRIDENIIEVVFR